MKRKAPGEQQRHDLGAPQTGARFVLNLEECVYFSGNTGSGRFGVPTIIITKNQYYSTTITLHQGRSVTSRPPLTLATGPSGSRDFFP